jgi:hypothetical protein
MARHAGVTLSVPRDARIAHLTSFGCDGGVASSCTTNQRRPVFSKTASKIIIKIAAGQGSQLLACEDPIIPADPAFLKIASKFHGHRPTVSVAEYRPPGSCTFHDHAGLFTYAFEANLDSGSARTRFFCIPASG